MKIKSILCLLSQDQLDEFYGANGIQLFGDLPEEGFYRRPCAGAGLSDTAAVHCGFGNDSKGAYGTAETLADSLQRRN